MAIYRKSRDHDDARAYQPRPQLAAPGAASGLMRKQRTARPAPDPAQNQPEAVTQRGGVVLEQPADAAPVTTVADLTGTHLGAVITLAHAPGTAPLAGVLAGLDRLDETTWAITIGQAPGVADPLPPWTGVVGDGARVEVVGA